jgi:hypothetical protein
VPGRNRPHQPPRPRSCCARTGSWGPTPASRLWSVSGRVSGRLPCLHGRRSGWSRQARHGPSGGAAHGVATGWMRFSRSLFDTLSCVPAARGLKPAMTDT